MKPLLTAILLVSVGTLVLAAQKPQTFTGTITDNVCAKETHGAMRMGPTDAECTRICVMTHDGDFVLLDEQANAYILSDRVAADTLAGQKVRVVGRLDTSTNTIQVESISALQ